MNVLALGASRNIGYDVCLELLQGGSTVTFLLRRKDTFDNDQAIKPFIKSGHVKLVIGDALSRDDVARAWKSAIEANETGVVDLVLSSIGSTSPSFSLIHGTIINPPNLVTVGMYNLLTTWPASLRTPSKQSKLIAVAAMGCTPSSMSNFSLPIRWVVSWLLKGPFLDKRGLEKVVVYAAGKGKEWNEERDGDVPSDFLPEAWEDEVATGEGGWLREYLVVQPAPFYGSPPTLGNYRASEETPGAWTVARKEISHFIVEKALKEWDVWRGRRVNLAY